MSDEKQVPAEIEPELTYVENDEGAAAVMPTTSGGIEVTYPDRCPECAAFGMTRGVSATVLRGSSILRRCRAGHTW